MWRYSLRIKYLQLLLILFISACIPTENTAGSSSKNLSFIVSEKCLAPQSFSFHLLTSEMHKEKWKTASDSQLINLIKNKDWFYVGKGQSSLVFQAEGLPFILKVPFTVGNVDMGVKETFQRNIVLRFLISVYQSQSQVQLLY